MACSKYEPNYPTVDWKLIVAQAKDFYQQAPLVAQLTAAQIGIWLCSRWLVPHLAQVNVQVHRRPWTVLTCHFLHYSTLHILGNLYGFFMIGPYVESALGASRFAGLWIVSSLASSAFEYFGNPRCQMHILGSSGCIFGLLGALSAYHWQNPMLDSSRLLTENWITVAAGALMSGLALQGAGMAFLGSRSPLRIAHLAHIGGFCGGFGFVSVAGPQYVVGTGSADSSGSVLGSWAKGADTATDTSDPAASFLKINPIKVLSNTIKNAMWPVTDRPMLAKAVDVTGVPKEWFVRFFKYQTSERDLLEGEARRIQQYNSRVNGGFRMFGNVIMGGFVWLCNYFNAALSIK